MTTMGFALIVATFVGLLTTWRPLPRWLNGAPIILAGLALVQLVVDGYSANLLPVYIVVVGLLGVAVKRLVQPGQPAGKSRQGISLILAVLGRGLGLLALFLAVRATLFFSLPPADLRQMTWDEAFTAMHRKLSREYAFSEWKQIDWDVLYATYAPQITAAQAQHNQQAYYLALLGYISFIPDGHVWLEGDDFGARETAVGGGYGLEILGMDDGRIQATTITPDGPAANAGMQWGAEVLFWNDRPIETALAQTPVLWPERRGAPATQEGRRLAQYRLLVRAPVGTQTKVTFQNPGAVEMSEVVVTAVADDKMSHNDNAEPLLPPVENGVILPSGYGYLKINNEHNDDDFPGPVIMVREAMQLFVGHNVPGVILDVRGNRGGDDELVPQFVGHFFSQRDLYEAVTIYFQPFHTFIKRPSPLWIEPLEPPYDGPVVVLIDNATFSSGEGIPMAIQRLPQGVVIGFYGTYGSFGMTGGLIRLPEGLTLHFPDGQSIDAHGVIQLDSNAAMQGGVAPTIRVPMTEETARAFFVEKEDVLLDFAVQYLDSQ